MRLALLAMSFMAKTDELYAGLKSKCFHVLATGWDDRPLYRDKERERLPQGSSQDEPLLWTVPYGAGHVFTTVLGDMMAVHTPGFITTFVRGTEWAATGAVTIPPPPELAR